MKNSQASIFEEKSITKILLKTAPPIMLAMLIQALYNIVDSFFVGRFSEEGLTALSVIFPLQLIITALAVGTGVGVNTLMSRYYAKYEEKKADDTAGTGLLLAIITWVLFSVVSLLIMRPYVMTSAKSALAVDYAVVYGNIVCLGSFGIFLESIWTKVHQAKGNMRLPMIAQIAGAVTNIILDPVLIFGIGFFPEMGVAGAAYATVAGQVIAAIITFFGAYRPIPSFKIIKHYAKRIYKLGYPSILMQSLYTVYIVGLNIILASFCDEAVTVLGLYYKLQTFFFIPLFGLQTCIVPLISYNFAQQKYDRCKKAMLSSLGFSAVFMLLGVFCFEFIPIPLLKLFSSDETVFEIGRVGFRVIGASFIPVAFSLMLPVFFQAIGKGGQSAFLSILRQIFCLVPLFWLFSRWGLDYGWWAFPVSEIISGGVGILMFFHQTNQWKGKEI